VPRSNKPAAIKITITPTTAPTISGVFDLRCRRGIWRPAARLVLLRVICNSTFVVGLA
jgi:hypothetical protein